jgi:hypothetical protein
VALTGVILQIRWTAEGVSPFVAYWASYFHGAVWGRNEVLFQLPPDAYYIIYSQTGWPSQNFLLSTLET